VFTGYAAQTRSLLVSGGQTNLGAGLSYKNSWLEFPPERCKIGPNFNPFPKHAHKAGRYANRYSLLFAARNRETKEHQRQDAHKREHRDHQDAFNARDIRGHKQ